jgi:hypothetical protein
MKEVVIGVIEGKFSIRIMAESILIRKGFLKLGFNVAENLRIPRRFNREKRKARNDFFYSFSKHKKNLERKN